MRYGRTWSPARKNNSARHSRINAAVWELLLVMPVTEAAFGVIATSVFYAYARTELVARKLV